MTEVEIFSNLKMEETGNGGEGAKNMDYGAIPPLNILISSEKGDQACSEAARTMGTSVKPEAGKDKKNELWNRYLGIVLAALAAVQFSLSALIIKILKYNPLNLGVWRFGTMLILTLPFLIQGLFCQKEEVGKKREKLEKGGTGIFKEIWPLNRTSAFLFLQAVLGSNSIIFVFFGLSYLDIGDSIVIGTSAPVFVTFLAWIFLNERLGIIPILNAILALIGVAVICKPPIITGLLGGTIRRSSDTLTGVTFSFSSMILLSFYYVIIRSLREVHHSLVQSVFFIWGILESLLLSWFFGVLKVPQSYSEILLICGSALLAFSAQTCVTFALKYEQTGIVALVRTTEVLFCYMWQYALLHAESDLFSLIGAVITLGCVMIAAVRKTVMSLEEGSGYRKRLAFLLY